MAAMTILTWSDAFNVVRVALLTILASLWHDDRCGNGCQGRGGPRYLGPRHEYARKEVAHMGQTKRRLVECCGRAYTLPRRGSALARGRECCVENQ
ncbi:hypothetical protein DFH29DRAFT_950586 [Suillus ampliporus]|nr:hypothetical protein DFH29DRAFT_950586 [Suillus ampliporus]